MFHYKHKYFLLFSMEDNNLYIQWFLYHNNSCNAYYISSIVYLQQKNFQESTLNHMYYFPLIQNHLHMQSIHHIKVQSKFHKLDGIQHTYLKDFHKKGQLIHSLIHIIFLITQFAQNTFLGGRKDILSLTVHHRSSKKDGMLFWIWEKISSLPSHLDVFLL